jgi:ATPase subunit of ABC transporter with duplicated ATPase domains
MSELAYRLNTIKRLCSLDWMTPSQRLVWTGIQERLQLGDVVNVYGQAGSGKTFLCWLLIKEQNAVYAPTLAALPKALATSSLLIIDNQLPGREAFRTLLTHLSAQQRQQTIVITQTAIYDDCYKAALSFTDADHRCVQQKLATLDLEVPIRTGGTLHHLINPDLPLDTEESLP